MISKKNFYLFWPYKCAYQNNTVPRPYFPKTEVVCDHPDSLSYNEWNEIVETYLEELAIYLSEGKKFEIPNRLGYFEMCKWKPKKFKLIGAGKNLKEGEPKLKKASRLHTGNYSPILKWRRPYNLCSLEMPWIFSIRMLKKLKRFTSTKFKKNYLLYNDV